MLCSARLRTTFFKILVHAGNEIGEIEYPALDAEVQFYVQNISLLELCYSGVNKCI